MSVSPTAQMEGVCVRGGGGGVKGAGRGGGNSYSTAQVTTLSYGEPG